MGCPYARWLLACVVTLGCFWALSPLHQTGNARSKRDTLHEQVDLTKCKVNTAHTFVICVPINETTTVSLPYDSFPFSSLPLDKSRDTVGIIHNSARKHGLLPLNWYITVGGQDTWTWKHLVAETAAIWSSYTTDFKAQLWRKHITLKDYHSVNRNSDGAKGYRGTSSAFTIIIKAPPLQDKQCQLFTFSVWIKPAPWWAMWICAYTSHTPSVDSHPAIPGTHQLKTETILINGKGMVPFAPVVKPRFSVHGSAGVNLYDKPFDGNTWYSAVSAIVRAAQVNASCYVCSLFPKSQQESSLLKPEALSSQDVFCILLGLKHQRRMTGKGLQDKWIHTNTSLFNNCSSWNDNLIRINSTDVQSDTTGTLKQPVATIDQHLLPEEPPICFKRTMKVSGSNLFVGNTEGCQTTLTATCSWHPYNTSPCISSPDEAPGKTLPGIYYAGNILWPSDAGCSSPTSAAWMCGSNIYQVLPPNWTGTCTLISLHPTVTLHSQLVYSTHHYTHFRQKRNTHVPLDRVVISPGAKFLSGLLPWWGSVNNAHKIDKLHMQLENLTSLTSQGFSAFPPFMVAARNMLMQHQLALDLLLAADGGLCHVIGSKCCSYVPLTADNITETVSHMNDLLAQMKAEEVPTPEGFNLWSWLTGGSWWQTLLKVCLPLITFLILFCVLFACIIPCLGKIINNAIGQAFYQYELVRLTDM